MARTHSVAFRTASSGAGEGSAADSCVEWAEDWSERKINAAIDEDRIEKGRYYGRAKAADSHEASKQEMFVEKGIWSRFRKRWSTDE